MKRLSLTLLALTSLSTQALVKHYQYGDGDRLRRFKAEPVQIQYQHDLAGNRNTKLILSDPITNPHQDIAFNLVRTDLNSVDPNSRTPLQWQLQGKDQKQLWQFMVSLYQQGKAVFQQAGLRVREIFLPILESGAKYDLKLEAENAYHGQIVLEHEVQTSNHPPSKPSLSVFLNEEYQYEAQWLSTDQDVSDSITYTLEVQGLLEDKAQWSSLYQGALTTKVIPLDTTGIAGSKQLKFRVAATDGKSAPIYSGLEEVLHSLINFESDDFNGFYFWTAPNSKGAYKQSSSISERWTRQQSQGGDWSYRWVRDSTIKQGYTATYVDSKGSQLEFRLNKSHGSFLTIYANGARIYDSGRRAVRGRRVAVSIPIGPTKLVFKARGNRNNEAVAIDDLLVPGLSDSDQDGVSDGFEIAHYGSLEAHTLDSLMTLDSDNDGVSDFDEYQSGTSPTTAGK